MRSLFFVILFIMIFPIFADCNSACTLDYEQCIKTKTLENLPRDNPADVQRTCSETYQLCNVECVRRANRGAPQYN